MCTQDIKDILIDDRAGSRALLEGGQEQADKDLEVD